MTKTSSEKRVVFINLAREKYSQTIANRLDQLGYLVTSASEKTWLNNPFKDTATIHVFALDEHYFQLKSKLFNVDNNPTLVLLCCTNEQLSKDIVKVCGDFALWPCSNEELMLRLSRLMAKTEMAIEPASIRHFEEKWINLNLVGKSPVFLQVLAIVEKSAKCDVPILVEGETGTGKEEIARAIHYLSSRRDDPFIPVNCGALPDTLIENELFGHEKGAYTDAKNDQSGLISQAEGGTLFLDEIESLPSKAQATILRFAQGQEYKPLGSKVPQKANVRIIAASNRPVSNLVAHGQLRSDLMYRLNVVSVKIPPLRERVTDIERLAEHFMNRIRIKYQKPEKQFHTDVINWMKSYHWPGNIRELENFIHREFVLTEGPIINLAGTIETDHTKNCRRKILDRRQAIVFDLPFSEAKHRVIEQFEQGYLSSLIKSANGNVTLAGKLAHKERRAIGKLLKKHCIDKDQYVR